MIKKIGTLTFHRAFNFGAMLQAYALQVVLQERYDAEIIDYRNEKIEYVSGFKTSFKDKLISFIRFFLRHKLVAKERKKRKNFLYFYNNFLKISVKKYTKNNFKNIQEQYDLCIVGSDQVWNPRHTNNDLNYFLYDVNPSLLGTYAVSFGNNASIETSSNNDAIKKYISRFSEVLVREEDALDYIHSIGVSCNLACDPIFLLTKQNWIDYISLKEKNDEEFILLFLVAPQTHAIEFAKQLAKKHGLKIKYISTYGSFKMIPNGCDDCMESGPVEFLNLLYNAKYIVTTSFHGMAFSINFNKQFYYELDKRENANNSRLLQLAKEFGLSNREIKSSELISNENIDYKIINGILERNRTQSRELLFEQIKKRNEE